MKSTGVILSMLCSLMMCADLSTAQWSRMDFQGQSPGGEWLPVPHGSDGTLLYSIASSDVVCSVDSGFTWRALESWRTLPPGYPLMWPSRLSFGENVGKGPRLFVTSGGYGIYLTVDTGATWTNLLDSLPLNQWGLVNVTDVVAVDTLLLASTGNGVYRRGINAAYWASSGLTGQIVRKVSACPNGAGGTNLLAWVTLTPGAQAYRSTDLGASWVAVNLTYSISDFVEYDNGVSGVKLFASTGVGIFCSTDYGQVWLPKGADFNAVWVPAMATYNGAPGASAIFAGTYDRGVFVSHDAGVTYQAYNAGLGYTSISSLFVFGGYLYTVTGGGIWKRPLSDVTAVSPGGEELPGRFTLDPNYPNPFNPGTTIRYSLAERSRVTLTIFNSLGQHVATLVEKEEEAGSHAAVFDGSGFASGVYICRLQAGAFVQSRKLLLLR